MRLNYAATVKKIINKVNNTRGMTIDIEKLNSKTWTTREIEEFCEFVRIEPIYS